MCCPICSLEIEYEKHVLTRCPTYNYYRDESYSSALTLNDNDKDMNDWAKMYTEPTKYM